MTRRHASPKARPVAAVLIVAATVFLLLGRSCGVLGALVAGSVDRLLGVAGTGLLCVTAWALAFILATPPGTLTRMAVAVWRHTVTRRHTPSVVVMNRKAAEPAAESTAHPLTTRHRRALDDVRTALKSLGYLRHEIEPVVATLNPDLPLENILRTAIKSLQVN